jgi:hypothetical protein
LSLSSGKKEKAAFKIQKTQTLKVKGLLFKNGSELFVLVSVLPQLLLAFVGRNFSQFAFSSAGHCISFSRVWLIQYERKHD